MRNLRVHSDITPTTADFTFVKMGSGHPDNWPPEWDFAIRCFGGSRDYKPSGKYLGKIYYKEDIPPLNSGLLYVKAHVDGVDEVLKDLTAEKVMWFTLHPYLGDREIVEYYNRQKNK